MYSRPMLHQNIAFGAFLVCGLVGLVVNGVTLLPMSQHTATALGLLLVIPLFLVAAVAMLIGVLYTLFLRDPPPLFVLSIASALLMAELVTEFGGMYVYNGVAWVYSVLATVLPLLWFFRWRWHFVE